MDVLAIILGLCLSGGLTQDAARPQGVENFCGVMKDPKLFLDKPITLRADAHILYGGVLLNSDECKVPDVSVHYMSGYEKGSDAEAVERLRRFRQEVHAAHLRGAGIEAEQIKASVVLEGRLDKNPNYRRKWDRGPATLAAWDYNEEYAFVVTRVVSLRRSSLRGFPRRGRSFFMADNQRGETIAGVAVTCGMAAGFAGFVVAVFSFLNANFVGAGVCLAAAGLSFGLVANASLRQ